MRSDGPMGEVEPFTDLLVGQSGSGSIALIDPRFAGKAADPAWAPTSASTASTPIVPIKPG